MTDKEVKRLSRSQLIDIIYQLQMREEELVEENKRLNYELNSRQIRMEKVGNIAEAVLELNDVFVSAQNAAEQYLVEIQRIRASADAEREQIISKAKEDAERIVKEAVEDVLSIRKERKKMKEVSAVEVKSGNEDLV